MKHTVLHRTLIQPARLSNEKDQDHQREQTDCGNYFVALGMRPGDLGYHHVLYAVSQLGDVAHFNQGLVYLSTSLSIDQAFKRINKSIVDPRIPSDVGLLILDPRQAHAKWYLSSEVSELLINYWHNKNNLFICLNKGANSKLIYDINALGMATPIGEHIWYVSSAYTPKEAYQILSTNKEKEERLTVFDATGRVASWQADNSRLTVRISGEDASLPTHASIHSPQSWQQSTLAAFL